MFLPTKILQSCGSCDGPGNCCHAFALLHFPSFLFRIPGRGTGSGCVRAGLGSGMASPKYWRNGSPHGCTRLICGAGNSCFCCTASSSRRREGHGRIGCLPGLPEKKVPVICWDLPLASSSFFRLRTLYSPSCFNGIGTLEYYYPLVLII